MTYYGFAGLQRSALENFKIVLAKPTFSWLSLHGIYEEPIYQYCPKCLKSDSIPYFRQSWRIATNEICPIHSVFLQLNCPHCQKHINLSTYSRLTSTLKKSLLYCNKCGKSLAQGKQKNANSSPHQDKLRKQKEIYGLIKSTSSHWKSKSLSNHAKARVNKCAAEAISKYRDEYIDGDWGELKTPPGIEWLLPSLNDKKQRFISDPIFAVFLKIQTQRAFFKKNPDIAC